MAAKPSRAKTAERAGSQRKAGVRYGSGAIGTPQQGCRASRGVRGGRGYAWGAAGAGSAGWASGFWGSPARSVASKAAPRLRPNLCKTLPPGLKRGPDHSDTDRVSLPRARIRPPENVPLTDMLAALSFSLDLTEGQPMGHALRTDLIALEIAARLDLPLQVRRDIHYAALLKDAGCSSNAAAVADMFGGNDISAKRARMTTDWTNDLQAALYAMEQAAPGASWFERAKRVAAVARLGQHAAVRLVQIRCERGA